MQPVWTLALLLAATAGYRESIEAWRSNRETALKAEDGWLTVTGLFWLVEGENKAGSAPGCRVTLPAGLPRDAGVFIRHGRRVQWLPAGGALRTLETDKTGAPDIVQIGRVRLHIIERGTRLGVRLKDSESTMRRNFRGLEWFPITQEWDIRAKFIRRPRTIVFDAQAGDKQRMTSPGYAEWTWRGRTLRLTPVTEDKQLFFVFRDQTAGKTTYSAARFLYADLGRDGTVRLDFNKAFNPPCVYTPYATCPLPPAENRLPVAVEAGEKMYRGR